MDGATPSPYFTVGPEDHAGWLVVVSIIFFLYSVMGVVGKIVLRAHVTLLRAPDFIIITSLVFLLIQTAFITLACSNGLGRHAATLAENQFDKFAKYYYGSSILAVVIEAMTKLSICLLISAISPDKKLLLANRMVIGIVTAWAISGVFGIGFACGLPNPWRQTEDGLCRSRRYMQVYNSVMNILTDLAISILPVVMMWHVKTTVQRKIQVCALFGCRIFVPCITIPALATSNIFYDNILTDPTWYAVTPSILFQISLNLSVLTACVPGLKSILENLVSNISLARVQNDYDLTRTGDKKSSFAMTPRHNSSSQSKNRTGSKSVAGAARRLRLGSSQHATSVTGDKENQVPGRLGSDADRSVSESTRNLTEGVIIRTDQYEVLSKQRRSAPSLEVPVRQSNEGYDEISPAAPGK